VGEGDVCVWEGDVCDAYMCTRVRASLHVCVCVCVWKKKESMCYIASHIGKQLSNMIHREFSDTRMGSSDGPPAVAPRYVAADTPWAVTNGVRK